MSVLFGSICNLQQFNDLLHEKEMSYMRETNSFRAEHYSYLSLEGLGKVQSGLPILCNILRTFILNRTRLRKSSLSYLIF